jgi:hypothetical protein
MNIHVQFGFNHICSFCMIKAKLYMNVHWMVLYNLKVFCSDIKFKMAATAGLSIEGKNFIWLSSVKGSLNECGLAYIWNT